MRIHGIITYFLEKKKTDYHYSIHPCFELLILHETLFQIPVGNQIHNYVLKSPRTKAARCLPCCNILD